MQGKGIFGIHEAGLDARTLEDGQNLGDDVTAFGVSAQVDRDFTFPSCRGHEQGFQRVGGQFGGHGHVGRQHGRRL